MPPTRRSSRPASTCCSAGCARRATRDADLCRRRARGPRRRGARLRRGRRPRGEGRPGTGRAAAGRADPARARRDTRPARRDLRAGHGRGAPHHRDRRGGAGPHRVDPRPRRRRGRRGRPALPHRPGALRDGARRGEGGARARAGREPERRGRGRARAPAPRAERGLAAALGAAAHAGRGRPRARRADARARGTRRARPRAHLGARPLRGQRGRAARARGRPRRDEPGARAPGVRRARGDPRRARGDAGPGARRRHGAALRRGAPGADRDRRRSRERARRPRHAHLPGALPRRRARRHRQGRLLRPGGDRRGARCAGPRRTALRARDPRRPHARAARRGRRGARDAGARRHPRGRRGRDPHRSRRRRPRRAGRRGAAARRRDAAARRRRRRRDRRRARRDPGRGHAVKLAELSIRRPVFAAMLNCGLVVLGLVSLSRLELKLEPKIDFPYTTVTTELRGASPETVEREVTEILEEQLNSIEGIHHLDSTSEQGLSRIHIEFGLAYDVDVKAQEVRDKVAAARPQLPVDVETPVVEKYDLSAVGFLTIVLGGPIAQRDFAEHGVKERLERIPGVGGINLLGARKREVRIWLDPLRLSGYGLAIEDVADTLRRENAELASGRIEGSAREWSVTTQGKARTVEEVGAIIVAERAGRPIQLRDVAVVEDGMAEERSVARLDGAPGVALEVLQQSGSDIVAATRMIRAEIERIRAVAPEGVQITVLRDYGRMIEEQVAAVMFDMVLAAALVMGVVLVFMRNWRSTLIASVAIPASVISSFTLVYAFGLSLNNMTLMALSLSVGLVIDDAIVVLEAIFRKVEAGEEPIPAALSGSREVGLAVISTTLAVCGVFVPIRFMTSTMGRYFYEFGVTVTVAVAISALVALTL